MKKFKKWIEIKRENLTEILDCPIVDGVWKKRSGCRHTGYNSAYAIKYKLMMRLSGYSLPGDIDSGGVLAQDVCGNWVVFSEKEWERHKNDEIKED